MKVNFGGIVPVSTIDWYGKSSIVTFFAGCPFRCSYCQNYKLINKVNFVDIEEIEKKILDSKDFITAIVFSGGEPTMQFDALVHLTRFAKSLGLLVGIETNGYYPDRLELLIKEGLVDKIFLDIKAPLGDSGEYHLLTGIKDAALRVNESLHISLYNGSDIEVRTTIFRHFPDVLEIAKELYSEAKELYSEQLMLSKDIDYSYVIQQGLPEFSPDGDIKKEMCLSRDELINIAKQCHFLKYVGIRTRDNGEERIIPLVYKYEVV